MAALFREHRRLVEGLCRSLLRDPLQAEDACQQAFLSAYEALLRRAEPREPVAWLAAIARNECRARLRARMREALPGEDDVDRPSVASDPAVVARDRDQLRALLDELRVLPESQRRALLLRQIGGLSYEELSARLGVSVSAIEALLFRARARLRERVRAAQAALAGTGWLSGLQDAIAQLFSGRGATKVALPLAVKAVAVVAGLGALAGGSSVAVESHHHGRPSQRAYPVAIPTERAPAVARVAVRAVRSVHEQMPVAPRSSRPVPAAQPPSTAPVSVPVQRVVRGQDPPPPTAPVEPAAPAEPPAQAPVASAPTDPARSPASGDSDSSGPSADGSSGSDASSTSDMSGAPESSGDGDVSSSTSGSGEKSGSSGDSGNSGDSGDSGRSSGDSGGGSGDSGH
ncbi:MAG TPA: sigma-70 family RNA polymerase sigma factor [Candidatus Binatia bacterium]|nr:sigma-70 family RNA polymerase sigma factor [Candidatus Binatia bacterium]